MKPAAAQDGAARVVICLLDPMQLRAGSRIKYLKTRKAI